MVLPMILYEYEGLWRSKIEALTLLNFDVEEYFLNTMDSQKRGGVYKTSQSRVLIQSTNDPAHILDTLCKKNTFLEKFIMLEKKKRRKMITEGRLTLLQR